MAKATQRCDGIVKDLQVKCQKLSRWYSPSALEYSQLLISGQWQLVNIDIYKSIDIIISPSSSGGAVSLNPRFW